jgi:hypothetical protein
MPTARRCVYEYHLCDCNWFDGVVTEDIHVKESIAGGIATCGCGEKHCRLYRDVVIHWEGKHWRLGCAFHETLRRLKKE